MDARLTKVLQAQHAAYMKNPHENILVWVDDADLTKWYFLVVGLDAPYKGGEYIFRLDAPAEFPTKPPSFSFLTPNGVFEPGGPICISIGEFHADNKPGRDGSHGWRPALGMAGFASNVVNGMICPDTLGGGIRVRNDDDARKRALARRSRRSNAKEARIHQAFEAIIASQPDFLPCATARRARGGAEPEATNSDAPADDAPEPGAGEAGETDEEASAIAAVEAFLADTYHAETMQPQPTPAAAVAMAQSLKLPKTTATRPAPNPMSASAKAPTRVPPVTMPTAGDVAAHRLNRMIGGGAQAPAPAPTPVPVQATEHLQAAGQPTSRAGRWLATGRAPQVEPRAQALMVTSSTAAAAIRAASAHSTAAAAPIPATAPVSAIAAPVPAAAVRAAPVATPTPEVAVAPAATPAPAAVATVAARSVPTATPVAAAAAVGAQASNEDDDGVPLDDEELDGAALADSASDRVISAAPRSTASPRLSADELEQSLDLNDWHDVDTATAGSAGHVAADMDALIDSLMDE